MTILMENVAKGGDCVGCPLLGARREGSTELGVVEYDTIIWWHTQ